MAQAILCVLDGALACDRALIPWPIALPDEGSRKLHVFVVASFRFDKIAGRGAVSAWCFTAAAGVVHPLFQQFD